MKTPADIQAMIRTLHAIGVTVPFGVYGGPDNHEPTETIAQVFASGLGMPDRDYYFKPEERFQTTRDKYKAYVTTIFTLAGSTEAQAQAAAASVFAMETRLADASLDNVALRDPQATDHKTTFAALQKMTPHFDWTAYVEQAGLPTADLNVQQPKFMAATRRCAGERVARELDDLSEVAAAECGRAVALTAVCRGDTSASTRPTWRARRK